MKYYNKMLTTFITVSIVYTLLIEAIFFTGYYAFTKYAFEKNAKATAVSAAEYTDFRIQSVRQMYLLVRANSDANKYCSETPSTPNRFARLKLHEFIRKVHGASSVEIQHLAVSRLTDDYVILDDSSGDLKFFASEFRLDREDITYIENAFQSDSNLPFLLIETTSSSGGTEYIMVVCDKVAYPSKLYFFAKFSASRFIDPKDSAAVALTYGGKIIAASGEYTHEEIYAAFTGDGGFYTKTVASSVNGVSYLYMTPKPQILFSTTAILIFLSGLAASCISIVAMLKVTKGIYDPIKRLVKTIGDTNQSEDEISFIQGRYKALKEQMDSMNTSLYIYSDNANKKLLRDLLTGIMSPGEAKNHFSNPGFLAKEGLYTSVLIKVMDAPDAEENIVWDKLGEVKELLLPLLSGKTEMNSLIEISADMLGLIFTGMETDAVSDIMKNLISAIEPDGGFELCAAIGPPCDKIENIYDSYKIANRMMLHSDSDLHRHRVLTPDYIDRMDDSYRPLYYPLNIEQNLINGVLNNKENLWRSALAEIIDGNQNLTEFSHISLMLSTTAARIAGSVNRKLCEFFTDGYVVYLEFRSCRSIEEIGAKTEEVFSSMSLGINHLRELSNEGLGNKMKGFIRANYHKNISLHDLADHMNMSRNYVSTAFKNATGVNFKEFINEIRYNAACEIISDNPETKLMDVADRVGCNSEILVRLFLRYYGGTPSDYQRQVIQDGQKS